MNFKTAVIDRPSQDSFMAMATSERLLVTNSKTDGVYLEESMEDECSGPL